jgi:surfeit locus 1 family protein
VHSLSINPWTRIGLTFLLIAACAGLASLGVWQLHRAHEKQARYQAFARNQASPPLVFENLALSKPVAENMWRRVTVQGHYLDQHIILDNRTKQGRPGFEILTPFLSDNGTAILVNRGWVPLPDARSTLPDVLAPADPVVLSGYIGPEPVVGIELAASAERAEIMSTNVFRVQGVKLAGLASLLDRPLWGAVVYLDPQAPGALSVAWQMPGDGSARNRSYAVQWFAMAAVLAAIGFWNLYGKRRAHD